MKQRAGALAPWLIVGVIGWVGVLWIGWSLWQSTPPHAGFDLALLLQGARRVLAGQSPYDPAILTGTSPDATSLFYAYPPPVAQAMTMLAWLPDGIVLLLWALGATAGLGIVAAALARALDRPDPTADAVRAVAAVPLVLPFAVAVLFGNLDAWYPLAFGALLLTALPGATTGTLVAGGAAAAAISIAKLHPAPLLVWVAVRALRERGGPPARVLAGAVLAGVAIIGASLLIGGTAPWSDYARVIGVGATSELVDPRNLAPVSLIGQATGLDGVALRVAQAGVTAAVVVAAVLAGWRVRDPLTSFGIVAAASLMTLPVTWYHYSVALLPVAITLAVGRPASRPLIVLAALVVDLAIALPALSWLAIAILLLACGQAASRSKPLLAGAAAS